MKSTIVLASLCATAALATPLKARAIKTEWVYTTVTKTVTGTSGAVATTTPAAGQFFTTPEVPAVETPVVPAPVAEVTSAAPAPVVQPVPVDTPVVSAPAPSVVLPAPSSGSAPNDYAQVILDQHNIHRANHSAPALAWSSELASWAQTIGQTCVYGHSRAAGDGDYGQNIGAGTAPQDVGKMITNAMYNGEMGWYDFYGQEPDMSNFGKWGHFSQIVWADTKEIGCATVDCGSGLAGTGANVGGYFTVCNYRPAGNFGGRYAANILAPLGAATTEV